MRIINDKKRFITLSLLLLLYCSPFSAQKYSSKQIDSLISSMREDRDVSANKTLQRSKYLWEISEINNYDKGKVESLRTISTIYLRMGKIEEALQQINTLIELTAKTKDYHTLCDAMRLKTLALTRTGLFDEAVQNADLALEYSKKISSPYHYHETRGLIYQAKAIVLYDKEERYPLKSVLSLRENLKASQEFLKAYNIDKTPPENLIISYTNVANDYYDLKKADSAKIYIDSALKIDSPPKYEYSKSNTYQMLGKYYQMRNQHKEAVENFLKSYQLNKHYSNDPYFNRDIFKLLAASYKELGDPKYPEYLEKYQRLEDSISLKEKKALSIPVKEIAADHEKKARKKVLYVIIIPVLLLILVLAFIYWKYKKVQKQKTTKEIQLLEKDTELEEMGKKINEAFNEVRILAENNDPTFLSRFKEVYPDFYTKLTTTYPALTPDKLKLCALLKLNLSTKEIAHYSHISIRSVEIKRGRLRKDLNIATSENLNKWMMEF